MLITFSLDNDVTWNIETSPTLIVIFPLKCTIFLRQKLVFFSEGESGDERSECSSTSLNKSYLCASRNGWQQCTLYIQNGQNIVLGCVLILRAYLLPHLRTFYFLLRLNFNISPSPLSYGFEKIYQILIVPFMQSPFGLWPLLICNLFLLPLPERHSLTIVQVTFLDFLFVAFFSLSDHW